MSCRDLGSPPKGKARGSDQGPQVSLPRLDIDAVNNGDTLSGVVVRAGFCLPAVPVLLPSSRVQLAGSARLQCRTLAHVCR